MHKPETAKSFSSEHCLILLSSLQLKCYSEHVARILQCEEETLQTAIGSIARYLSPSYCNRVKPPKMFRFQMCHFMVCWQFDAKRHFSVFLSIPIEATDSRHSTVHDSLSKLWNLADLCSKQAVFWKNCIYIGRWCDPVLIRSLNWEWWSEILWPIDWREISQSFFTKISSRFSGIFSRNVHFPIWRRK
jgi:hypothetical protein